VSSERARSADGRGHAELLAAFWCAAGPFHRRHPRLLIAHAFVAIALCACRSSNHAPEAGAAAAQPSASHSAELGGAKGVGQRRDCVTAASLGARRLEGEEPFEEAEREAVRAVRNELLRLLERPDDFRATLDDTDKLVVVELWHVSTLEECVDARDTHEKNRTLVYDVAARRIVSVRWKRSASAP
jgi:hypothetical protein